MYPIDDTAVEGNETVVLTVNGSGTIQSVARRAATVTIADNDVPPGPSITASPSTVSPNGNVTGSWAGVTSPTSRDWIGLYAAVRATEVIRIGYMSAAAERRAAHSRADHVT